MNYLVNIPTEVQERTLWCWAAVSTMVAKSFPDLASMTQLRIVAYFKQSVRKNDDLTPAKVLAVDNVVNECTDPLLCNSTGFAWPYDVDYTAVPFGSKLTKQRLIDEIKVYGRPVIIMWDYSGLTGRRAVGRPDGQHYLIITGYVDGTGFDDGIDRFRVFDPWLGRGSIPGKPEIHEYYISYEGYVDPQVSLGLPIHAAHEFDCYNLLRFGVGADQIAPPASDFDEVGPVERVVLTARGFGEVLGRDTEIQANARQRKVYAHDGSVVGGAKHAGTIFPIIGLTTKQVLEAHGALHRLLVPEASSLIAPVILDNDSRVVDSIEMYCSRGKWIVAEHSNSQIAQLMVVAAERMRNEFHLGGPVYLVSIPEQVMFFAACGETANARLISLDDVAKGPLLTGEEAYDSVIKFIKRRRKASQDRGRLSSLWQRFLRLMHGPS